MTTMNAIQSAYAAYDSDKRVNGPEDFEAFQDAVSPILDSFNASLSDFQAETERLKAENAELLKYKTYLESLWNDKKVDWAV